MNPVCSVWLAAVLVGSVPLEQAVVSAADAGLRAPAEAALQRAVAYYHGQVSRHGGYVYFYSVDLTRRLGEGVASQDQIWVQPPGTPVVGLAFLRAYEVTGSREAFTAAMDAAQALTYGQRESGGWTNCVDFNPRAERVARYRNGMGRGRNFSSLDDDQTPSAIRFLMAVDQANEFRHPEIHESVTVALDALLAAQFDNGAFPQGWDEVPVAVRQPVVKAGFPDHDWRTEGRIKEYWDMYTLNDDIAGNVSDLLIQAHQTYGEQRFLTALRRLGDFLILAQMPDPQPGWAQQYSFDMHPIWARRFEPPAVAGRESQDALKALLRISEYTGDRRYLEPVPRALAWLKRSLLPDGRLARYCALETNRPLYMSRRGREYSLTYDDSRLPKHYGWKVQSEIDAIEASFVRADRRGFVIRRAGDQ